MLFGSCTVREEQRQSCIVLAGGQEVSPGNLGVGRVPSPLSHFLAELTFPSVLLFGVYSFFFFLTAIYVCGKLALFDGCSMPVFLFWSPRLTVKGLLPVTMPIMCGLMNVGPDVALSSNTSPSSSR